MNEPTTDIAVREDELIPLRMNEAAIENVKHNVAMMEKAISSVLEEGIDYGTAPGIPLPFLFDPGASKVRDFFDTYPKHSVILHTIQDGMITIIMEANLIHRKTGRIVACGVGACSMEESKYKYIWVYSPEEYGLKKEDCRKKTKDNKTKYRIPNPDVEGLVNTITKMAGKRSEVDASQNLPGVSTAIAKLKKQYESGGRQSGWDKPKEENEWSHFWGQVKQMGLTRDEAHFLCDVASMKEWVDKGRTLEEALATIRDHLIARSKSPMAKVKEDKKKAAAEATPEDFLAAHEKPVEEIRRILKGLNVTEMDPRFVGMLEKSYGGIKVLEELDDGQAANLLLVLTLRRNREAPPPPQEEIIPEDLPF